MNKSVRIALFGLSAAILGFLLFFSRNIFLAATGAIAGTVTSHAAVEPLAVQTSMDSESYPYGGMRFSQLVEESYSLCRGASLPDFYDWMNMQYRISSVKYPGRENLTIEELLDSKRRDFDSMSDPARKSVAILNFASWLHRMVKATIPKFSLDRGFEFCNVVRYGERQCLLQSVLISGMLQRAGADAGIEMVFKSIKGEISNNGHVCVLLKMPNGKDVIIDASDPDPLARQQGLMTRVNNDYMFVLPVYEGSSSMIIYYKDLYGHGRLMPSAVRTLDLLFVNSQFWYYRGERVPGGLLYGKDKTSSGLALAGANLETSVKLCPRNPLSLYMLGRVYLDQGDKETAKKLIGRAMFLYGEYGYVPDGPKEFWRLVR